MGNLVVGPMEPATNLGLPNVAYLIAAFFAINAAFLFMSYALSAILYSSRTMDDAPKVFVSITWQPASKNEL